MEDEEEPELPDYQAAVRKDIPRPLLVDVKAAFETAAMQAKKAILNSHTAVDGGIVLGERRGNRAAGLIRFEVTDEAFEGILSRHGGTFISQVKVSRRDEVRQSPIYLTTAQFGGTLLGFASHREVLDLPSKNATRKALCEQNVGLGRDLFRGPELYVDRERFVLIMVQRDRFDIGTVASMTVAIVDPMITQFVMQKDINEFVASYGTEPVVARGIVLKKDAGRFRGKGDEGDEKKRE